MNSTKTIQIYTDGACKGNPGVGGLGICMLFGEHIKEYSEGYQLTTNNRMELLAVIRALSLIKRPELPIEIYSDSNYVINCMQQNWLARWQSKGFAKVKNPDLWRELWEILPHFKQITWIWVKGHAGNKYNNRCDFLAVQAYKQAPEKLRIDKQYLTTINKNLPILPN